VLLPLKNAARAALLAGALFFFLRTIGSGGKNGVSVLDINPNLWLVVIGAALGSVVIEMVKDGMKS
jgi:hypothetical protein